MSRRIIVQDISNRSYLGGDRSWVKSCQSAREFEHTHLALLEGLHHPERNLQVVWCFQNPNLNLYLPVDPARREQIQACVLCPLAAEGSPLAESGM